MTTLLQTRVPRELAARLRAAARAEGKSVYQVLRELAVDYAAKGPGPRFASEKYSERFDLPSPSRLKTELRQRIRKRHEEHH
jgi:hypothetical protein